MTQNPDEPQIDDEPQPEPATEAKPGVNDPDPQGTGSDEPLTSL